MPRSGAEARARLRQAALDLYLERGYDGTTTADIAERACVNHRTYFRHFADKREVLFDGQEELCESLVRSVADAPDGLPALTVLERAFLESAHVLESNQAVAGCRLRLIAETPALHERDLAKGAAMADALAAALERRGEPHDTARLVAAIGWTTFHEAATAWVAEPDRPLGPHLRATFETLRSAVVRAGG